MEMLFWAVLVPAEVVFFGILLYARATGMDPLFRRLWLGVVGESCSIIVLDLIRYPGVLLGLLPKDMPVVFGRHILGFGTKAGSSSLAYLRCCLPWATAIAS